MSPALLNYFRHAIQESATKTKKTGFQFIISREGAPSEDELCFVKMEQL